MYRTAACAPLARRFRYSDSRYRAGSALASLNAMRALPLRGWILIGALIAFSVAVLGVLYWAQFTGRAGSQRGLVIHNELSGTATVSIAGQTKTITPDDQETFVVKREQFPATIDWAARSASSSTATSYAGQEEVTYDFIAEAEFRISIDENGVYKTTDYRDTPVPRATEAP
jgi:hypothetical protein